MVVVVVVATAGVTMIMVDSNGRCKLNAEFMFVFKCQH